MSADKETGTAVATTEPTPTAAVEKVDDNPALAPDRYKDTSTDIDHPSLPAPRELNALWKMAGAYCAMPGIAAAYAGNQKATMAALLTAWQLDLPTTPMIVNEFFSWTESGRTVLYMSSAIVVALASKNGVELWFDEESDTTFARAFCRRRGEERVHSYKITMEEAVRAGFTKKKDGGTKDNWRAAPDVMLRYRSARRLLKSVAPDVVLGIPASVLDAEPIPVLDRDELQQRAIEITVDEDEDENADEGEGVDTSVPPAREAGSIPAPGDSPLSATGELWDERPFVEGDDE